MSENVLVVDDEVSIRTLIQTGLVKAGFSVTTVSSGEEALVKLDESEFAVVLTDIRMLGMDGITLAQEIKGRTPETEVIMVTGVRDVQAAADTTKLGAREYITKPFRMKDVVGAVQSAANHWRVTLERRRYQQGLRKKVGERTRALRRRDETLARLQQEISGMEKLSSIGVLAASVSHEVNNPLASIIGFAELISEMDDAGDKAKKFARVIQIEGEKIRRLTEQLLDISRQGKVERKVQDLNQVVKEVLLVTDHHLSRFQRVDIETDLHPEDLLCIFDRGQIQQVLLNLILNAAQAMENGGNLTVATCPKNDSEHGPGAGFSVSDTGPGVPPEIEEQIFKPFFTTKEKGTGLGLKICRDIIAGHGGSIHVKSDPGKGATFSVWLPAGPSEPRVGFPADAAAGEA